MTHRHERWTLGSSIVSCFLDAGPRALNHHIRSLEARIDELEKKIAEVKKQK